MTTITVSTTAQLQTALSSAHAGDVILLASGNYTGVSLRDLHFTSPVTITSADPSHPAQFYDFTLRTSSGLDFSNLVLNASKATADWPFRVYSSSDIHFSHLDVHGSMDGNPINDVSGLLIRQSSNVNVTDSNFEQLKTAIAWDRDDHLQISDNSFHDLSLDGVHGSATSYISITNNSFTDFFVASGAHPDAIQFWTTNTTTAAHDILISGNVIVRGDGAPMQGIFMTDQVGTLPYADVTISDNMLLGTRYHGITIGHGKNVTISGNTVAGQPDMLSWIRLDHVSGGSVTNNTAGELTMESDYNVSVSGFTELRPTLTQGQQMLAQWFASHSAIEDVFDGVSSGTQSDSGTTTVGQVEPPVVTTDLTLNGTSANDTLLGGSGNDTINGRAGADKMTGGDGNDIYYVDNSGDAVNESSKHGNDVVGTTISYSLTANVERLTLLGTGSISGNGNSLNNIIKGNNAANHIHGQDGNDFIYGMGGNDFIVGDAGKDTMTGGAGNDVFVFRKGDIQSDRITDFTSGQDRIDLSGIDARTSLSSDQAFTFIGASAFSHTAGQLHYQQVNGTTVISGDTNGDGIADFTINFDGLHTLTSHDFIL